jgi:hypothetical protein
MTTTLARCREAAQASTAQVHRKMVVEVKE